MVSVWPNSRHNSSVMCGANGAKICSKLSRVNRPVSDACILYDSLNLYRPLTIYPMSCGMSVVMEKFALPMSLYACPII